MTSSSSVLIGRIRGVGSGDDNHDIGQNLNISRIVNVNYLNSKPGPQMNNGQQSVQCHTIIH